MAKGDIRTYYENNSWKNKVEGNQQASSTHATKAEASAVGREMARERGAEHSICRMDGTIGEKNSCGRDANPPKG